MTLADWVRGVLLHSLEGPGEAQMEMHIFTELVGLQMLLMNTLEPLLHGDKLNPEQIAILEAQRGIRREIDLHFAQQRAISRIFARRVS